MDVQIQFHSVKKQNKINQAEPLDKDSKVQNTLKKKKKI